MANDLTLQSTLKHLKPSVNVWHVIFSLQSKQIILVNPIFFFFFFFFFQSHIPTVSDLPVVVFVYEVRQSTLQGSPISVIQNTYIQLYNHLHVIIQKGHQTISRVICIAPMTKPSAVRTHCTKYADIRRRIYQRRVKKQHLRIYYSHLYHTVFPCNHLISTAGLSFLPHITSIPLLFGFVFVQPPLNPPLF